MAQTAPISRLPAEILCVVFEQLRQHPANDGGQGFEPYTPITAAMLVCRNWHHVARKHATLWTEIALELTPRRGFSAPRWDAHLLEWSKAAPMKLRLEFSYAKMAQCEDVLLLHGGRVRRLDLFTTCVASVHELPRMLASLTAPSSLTHLTLSLPNPMEMGTPQVRASAGPMPSLQVLVLDRVVWLPSHSLPALTEVHMMGVQPLLMDELSALSTLAPNLTTLRLRACTLDRCRPDISDSTLTFPRLRTLAFTQMLASVTGKLLGRVVLPVVETIQVDCLSLHMSDPTRLLFPHPLAFADPIVRLDVFGPSFNHHSHGKMLSFIGEGERSTVSFNASPRWNDWAASWLLAIPTVLSVHALTSCRLRLSSWAREMLLAFAKCVPNLHHLVVQAPEEPQAVLVSGAVRMVEALGALLRSDLCPELASVGMCLPSTDCLPGLMAAIAGRAESGRQLRSLLVCVGTTGSGGLEESGYERILREHLLRSVDRVEIGCSPEELWPGELLR